MWIKTFGWRSASVLRPYIPERFLFRKGESKDWVLAVAAGRVLGFARKAPVFRLICQNQFEAGDVKASLWAWRTAPDLQFPGRTRVNANASSDKRIALRRLKKSYLALFSLSLSLSAFSQHTHAGKPRIRCESINSKRRATHEKRGPQLDFDPQQFSAAWLTERTTHIVRDTRIHTLFRSILSTISRRVDWLIRGSRVNTIRYDSRDTLACIINNSGFLK